MSSAAAGSSSASNKAQKRSGFKLLKKLGTGGYGSVYKATNSRNGNRQVALKEMTTCVETEGIVASVLQEIQCYLFMQHTNVCCIQRIFGDYESRTILFSMPMATNTDLKDYIARSKVLRSVDKTVVPTIRRLGLQVVRGVAHMHQRRFLHCDLKPRNILVFGGGDDAEDGLPTLQIADMGLSRFLPTSVDGAFDESNYTVWWRAMEVFFEARVTFASDTFALALVLMQLLMMRSNSFGEYMLKSGAVDSEGILTPVMFINTLTGVPRSKLATIEAYVAKRVKDTEAKLAAEKKVKERGELEALLKQLNTVVHRNISPQVIYNSPEEGDRLRERLIYDTLSTITPKEVQKAYTQRVVKLIARALAFEPDRRPTVIDIEADAFFTPEDRSECDKLLRPCRNPVTVSISNAIAPTPDASIYNKQAMLTPLLRAKICAKLLFLVYKGQYHPFTYLAAVSLVDRSLVTLNIEKPVEVHRIACAAFSLCNKALRLSEDWPSVDVLTRYCQPSSVGDIIEWEFALLEAGNYKLLQPQAWWNTTRSILNDTMRYAIVLSFSQPIESSTVPVVKAVSMEKELVDHIFGVEFDKQDLLASQTTGDQIWRKLFNNIDATTVSDTIIKNWGRYLPPEPTFSVRL